MSVDKPKGSQPLEADLLGLLRQMMKLIVKDREFVIVLLTELLQPYVVPPAPLHEAAQEAARRSGWRAPWDQGAQKKAAGKLSARMRGGRAMLRLSLVQVARARLKPEQRRQPYADTSLDALCKEYRKLFDEGSNDHVRSRRTAWDELLPYMLAALVHD